MVLAPGRGFCEDQRRDPLSLAAVDHEGEVQEVFATKRRDRKAAMAFLRRSVKRHGRPRAIVTERLRSYRAAMREIGVERRQVCGRWLNNRAENSRQLFRRREGGWHASGTLRPCRSSPRPLDPRFDPQSL